MPDWSCKFVLEFNKLKKCNIDLKVAAVADREERNLFFAVCDAATVKINYFDWNSPTNFIQNQNIANFFLR
jgi:hypothetical protein